MKRVIHHWHGLEHHERMLRYVQPALIGLIDGLLASIAPVLAAAYISGTSKAPLIIGISVAIGSAVSMALSEGMSDDGELTGRGTALARGAITGAATFIGAIVHVLPFLIQDVSTALTIAYIIIAIELVGVAWIRQRFMEIPLWKSLIQVTLGGIIIAAVGILLGHS